ncbi:MAG: hypothetical protein ACK5QI_09150, partial [Alphaproteobacteria bacterium]
MSEDNKDPEVLFERFLEKNEVRIGQRMCFKKAESIISLVYDKGADASRQILTEHSQLHNDIKDLVHGNLDELYNKYNDLFAEAILDSLYANAIADLLRQPHK